MSMKRLVNRSPPIRALCAQCDGIAGTWTTTEPYVLRSCIGCAGTGRDPIPVTEVIDGLRYGNLNALKNSLWMRSGRL